MVEKFVIDKIFILLIKLLLNKKKLNINIKKI